MKPEAATARLPIVGEATRSPQREVLAPGVPPTPAPPASDRPPAAIIALHGVGQFAYGDVIGEIARQPVFSRATDYRRETVFAREYRYTALLQAGGSPAVPPGGPRFLEINWSEVRRSMPNVLGLLRHFVTLLMALDRIGVQGAYGSRSLAARLWTGVPALWLLEAALVWLSLAPALSALLWQLDPGQRMATGVLVGAASLYVAALVRDLSAPLAVGGGAFAVFSVCAGGWTCFVAQGEASFASFAARVHSWALLLACTALLASAIEILSRRVETLPAGADDGGTPIDEGVPPDEVRWVHRLARIACLWLPVVMLVVLQPLTVSALLLPMNAGMRVGWGTAFAAGLPFDPVDGQRAVSWIALAVAGTVVLGALQFKLVQTLGRNLAVLIAVGSGLTLLAVARWIEASGFLACELCEQCLRTDWLAACGLLLTAGACLTWILFAQSGVARDPQGRAWYPAGAFARFWAGVMLVAVPIVLTATLAWLLLRTWRDTGAHATSDASAIFLESTKYALLLAPLATRPFAAFLDALGDVFFYLVRQRNLNSRLDTLPRLWKALRLLDDGSGDVHVLVFAHSQGTVIAAGLLSRMARVLKGSAMRVTLVTVGSPVTTLYRNFLGASIGEGFAELCRAEPKRYAWFNVYRPADYIGGEIELDGVVNRELLTPGDHIGYWCDAELLKWIKSLADA